MQTEVTRNGNAIIITQRFPTYSTTDVVKLFLRHGYKIGTRKVGKLLDSLGLEGTLVQNQRGRYCLYWYTSQVETLANHLGITLIPG